MTPAHNAVYKWCLWHPAHHAERKKEEKRSPFCPFRLKNKGGMAWFDYEFWRFLTRCKLWNLKFWVKNIYSRFQSLHLIKNLKGLENCFKHNFASCNIHSIVQVITWVVTKWLPNGNDIIKINISSGFTFPRSLWV